MVNPRTGCCPAASAVIDLAAAHNTAAADATVAVSAAIDISASTTANVAPVDAAHTAGSVSAAAVADSVTHDSADFNATANNAYYNAAATPAGARCWCHSLAVAPPIDSESRFEMRMSIFLF